MDRKRDGLIPIEEVSSGLGGPVKKAIQTSSQALHHFTQADQVNQLVNASEADPDRGFMARTMALCSLPRSNPGDRTQYKRVNGPYTLIMSATGVHKLPYGNLPRLILAWLTALKRYSTQQPRAGPREIRWRSFMRSSWASTAPAAGKYTRLRNQMKRLFQRCSVSIDLQRQAR